MSISNHLLFTLVSGNFLDRRHKNRHYKYLQVYVALCSKTLIQAVNKHINRHYQQTLSTDVAAAGQNGVSSPAGIAFQGPLQK
jgi:hypothetical protein